MIPTLDDKDRLVVGRVARLRVGDLVVFSDPQERSRLLVKRIVGLHGDAIEVAGDNTGASRDSRSFGLVPRRLVRGVARYRYFPATQQGWFARPPAPRRESQTSPSS